MKKTLYLGVTMVLAAASAATGKGPETLSPGSLDLPVMAPSGCPTFSWSGSSDDRDFELVVYRFDDGDDDKVEAVARNEIQGIAFSWTPSECFSAGHYAWVVRAGDLEWSPPRFFVVSPEPGPDELAAALAVVSRFLEQQEARVSADSNPADAAGSQAPRLREARRLPPTHGVVGASTVAIRGHNQDPSGNALGVEASTDSAEGAGLLAANQAGGPDLRLDSQGGIDTEVTEAGIVRSSTAPQVFDIGNPEGDLTLTIDGVAAVTTATDQDTHYSPGNQLTLDGTTFDVLEGPGSGLDADTLDGLHASNLAAAGHLHAGSDIVSGEVAEARIASSLARDAEVIALVLASDGPGSNLDADTLDGLHASQLQPILEGECPAGTVLAGFGPGGDAICAPLPLRPELHFDFHDQELPIQPRLALTPSGAPVVSYHVWNDSMATFEVWLADCSDSACTMGIRRTLDPIASGAQVSSTDVAIGSDGWPVVVYDDWESATDTHMLHVVDCSDSSCSTRTNSIVATATGSIPLSPSIAVPPDGFPVVAYRGAGYVLEVVRCNDPACSGEDEMPLVPDPIVTGPLLTALAVGADGLPVVVVAGNTGGQAEVRLTRCGDASCSPAAASGGLVDTLAFDSVRTAPDLVVGPDDYPVVSYSAVAEGEVRIARCLSPACTAFAGAPFGPAVSSVVTSIAIREDGVPLIAFDGFEGVTLESCFDASCSGPGSPSTLLLDAGHLWSPSVAVGSDGLPVIASVAKIGGHEAIVVSKCRNADCFH